MNRPLVAKPLVYVAGPLTGSMLGNTAKAIRVGDDLMRLGFAVIVPHLSTFWHAECPHDYREWMEMDLAILARCDAVYRMDGPSPGADAEVAEASRLKIPVYTSMRVLVADLLPGKVA